MEDEDENENQNENMDEFHSIGYQLHHPKLYPGGMLAGGYLETPVGLDYYNNIAWSCPRVVMDIKNTDDIHCLKLMMSCVHKNILQAKIVTEHESCLVAWTEPFTGSLRELVEGMKRYLGDFTGMVPSAQLQEIVSQWFDGIGQLRLCQKYHGNFSLDSTYYHNESMIPVVKLTNFRVKVGKSLTQCQTEDVLAIADALDEIVKIVEEWNKSRRLPTWDCCLIIDLSKKLREVSRENLVSLRDIKKHMFFWEGKDRATFYVCDLPSALKNKDFRKDVEAADICNIPWDAEAYSGLLWDMNSHRASHNKPAYDGTKKTQFCSFCSGLYTHEPELNGVKYRRLMVDSVLQRRDPKACFKIVCLMPDRETKYMLSKREAKK